MVPKTLRVTHRPDRNAIEYDVHGYSIYYNRAQFDVKLEQWCTCTGCLMIDSTNAITFGLTYLLYLNLITY